MTKRQYLPGISYGLKNVPSVVLVNGLSETLGESMAMRLAHHLSGVSIPVSVPAFPCFPVAQTQMGVQVFNARSCCPESVVLIIENGNGEQKRKGMPEMEVNTSQAPRELGNATKLP